MRLGFGKNSENFMLPWTLILYNTAGSSYLRWLHNTPNSLFSENSHGDRVHPNTSGMRLGFGQNSGKFYDATDSNPIQYRRFWLLKMII